MDASNPRRDASDSTTEPDAAAPPVEAHAAPQPGRLTRAALLAGAALGTGLLAALLPPRLRLLGLLPAGQGLFTGWLAARFSAEALHGGWLRTTGPAALAGTVSVLVSTLLGWWNWQSRLPDVPRTDPAAALAARMLAEAEASAEENPGDPEARAALEAFRAGVRSATQSRSDQVRRRGLPAYLDHRVAALRLPAGTGLPVWAGELVLAAVAAGWMARRDQAAPAGRQPSGDRAGCDPAPRA